MFSQFKLLAITLLLTSCAEAASEDIGQNTATKLSFELKKELTDKGKLAIKASETAQQQKANYNRMLKSLIDPSSSTFYDPKTKLTWMRCSLGQIWNGQTCTGEAKRYRWQPAMNKAKQMTVADSSAWRLPTHFELHSIVHCSKGRTGIELNAEGITARINNVRQNGKCLGENYQRPTVNQEIFPNHRSTFYWSSSPSFANFSNGAWGVCFNSGYDFSGFSHNHSHLVRLVRSGQ